MTRTSTLFFPLTATLLVGCLDTGGGGGIFKGDDVSVEGNFEVNHSDKLSIYYNDALVGEVEAGTGATVDLDGQTFDVDSLCGTGLVTCHPDATWAALAIEMPYGFDVGILNVVHMDAELPHIGTRLGGLYNDGSFEAFLGGHHIEDTGCDSAMARSLYGEFNETASTIKNGVLMTAFDQGCTIGGAELAFELRIESTFRATRLDDLDLSDVEDEDEGPVDVEGDPID